jgi:hypothetical protein
MIVPPELDCSVDSRLQARSEDANPAKAAILLPVAERPRSPHGLLTAVPMLDFDAGFGIAMAEALS